MSNEISFSMLKDGMKIYFQDAEQNVISADVIIIHNDENDKSQIVGCAATDADGNSYALYKDDGIILYSQNIQPEIKQSSPQQINTMQSKIILPTNEPKAATQTKEINNLFQGRTEAEKGNAKFPNWDIVPPNQFINPRIKPQ